MSWRNIVTQWLSDKTITQQENRAILDLLQHLIQANMVPATFISNSTLHSIMLTQIVLETLNGLTVPPAPQDGKTFVYHMNAKEMMMGDLNMQNSKQIKLLEKQTGVNLDHYHKLKLTN